jgi:hypothetical protein
MPLRPWTAFVATVVVTAILSVCPAVAAAAFHGYATIRPAVHPSGDTLSGQEWRSSDRAPLPAGA